MPIVNCAAIGAAIVGGLGFFGPMILDPSSGNGPLLGIFITGPLGLVLGGIGGAIVGVWRRSERSRGRGDP